MIREMKTARGKGLHELLQALEELPAHVRGDKVHAYLDIDSRSKDWSLSVLEGSSLSYLNKPSKPDNGSPTSGDTMPSNATKEGMAPSDARESVIKDLTSLVHHAASCPDDCDIGRVAVLADSLHQYLADF